MLETLFFYAFAALALLGAILTVTLRNAVHCAISLIASLAGVAGLFLLQRAEFLFAVQIVLYIGGIMVLFLFVIMLVNLDAAARERQYHRHWIAGALSVVGTAAVFTFFVARGAESLKLNQPVPAGPRNNDAVQMLADTLFREYLVPFEVASLLLIGTVGILLRRNAVVVMMSIELILNAVNVNLIAFSRHLDQVNGQIFAIFVICVAVAEAAVGLGILIALFRNKETVLVDEIDLLKW